MIIQEEANLMFTMKEAYKKQIMETTDESEVLELLKKYWKELCECEGVNHASEEICAVVKKMIFYGIVERKVDLLECVGDLELLAKNYSKSCYWYQQAIALFSDKTEVPETLLEKRNLSLETAVNKKIKETPVYWEPMKKNKKSGKKNKQKRANTGLKEQQKKTEEQIKEMMSRKNVIIHINRKNISKKKCA